MLPRDWLNQFYVSRQITGSDKRPLYRYRMDDTEFESLKSSLKTTALFGIENILKTAGWNAAFVIYSAEWWRREYDGSSWSWDQIFASFNADVKVLTTGRRNLLVETGLRHWGRKVRIINGSSRYLGTIAIEGGLPLNQIISSSNDWLGRVFKQVIPKFNRLQHTGIKADTLIGECDYIIPNTYQNDQVHAILGDMVKTVVQFKQKYSLQECSDPVNVLDQKAPAWREDFPLPIGAEVGQKLLSDMVRFAAKAVDQKLSQPFRCVRKLSTDGCLQLHFEFAGFVTLDNLHLTETIPSRLDVELVGSNGTIESIGVALKTTYQAKPSLKMPRNSGIVKGDKAANGYWLRLKHLSKVIYEEVIADCEELDRTGELVTGFLTSTFSISRVQATKDIALYLSLRPDNLRYDRSLKRYLITEQFTPLLITGSPQECLQVLQASQSAAPPVVTLMSNLPTVEVLASPTRHIDVGVLRPVLQAARFGLVLEIGYQSMSSPEPAVRKVQPHTLVFDGGRWHMRAFSYSHNEFRDFVLARIHQAKVVGKPEVPCPVDTGWENLLTVEIGPHPGLSDSQKQAVERDFGMVAGKCSTTVRAALLSYLLLSMRIGKDDYQREAMIQQIVLLNRDELAPYLAF